MPFGTNETGGVLEKALVHLEYPHLTGCTYYSNIREDTALSQIVNEALRNPAACFFALDKRKMQRMGK